MKKVLLIGCNGQMGRVVQAAIQQHSQLELVAGIDRHPGETGAFPIYQELTDVQEKIDLVIDFSHHSMTNQVVDYCVSQQLPVVIATTGLSAEMIARIKEAGTEIPVFYSANMSLGVNALIKALQSIAPILEEDFQIEIIEKHHRNSLRKLNIRFCTPGVTYTLHRRYLAIDIIRIWQRFWKRAF